MKREWAKVGGVKPRQVGKTQAAPKTGLTVHAKSKPACTDCGSTTRKLTQVSPKVQLCLEDIRKRKKAKSIQGRASRQMRSFGITLEEEAVVIAIQGGGCICAPWTGYVGVKRSLSTDHDHTSGEIRGKLCKHCNDLLGRVRDDIAYFKAMIAYLENPPARRALGTRIVPGHIPGE